MHLVVGEPVHLALDGVHVTTPTVDDDGAVVAVATIVENESLVTTTTTTVTTEIVDDDGTVVARDVAPLTMFPGRPETLRQRLLVAQPRRWSVDAADPVHVPHRRSQATVTSSTTSRPTFGIRTLAVDPRAGLRINGEPVELRGACIHHDNGVLGAATIARADERRVEMLKEAGFNALRSAHNPMSRRDARRVRPPRHARDGRGVRHVDRAEDRRRLRRASFPDWWEADVDAMVRKDRNHPW